MCPSESEKEESCRSSDWKKEDGLLNPEEESQ